jgi:acyl carrier protein
MNVTLETRVCALLREVLALPATFPLERQTRLLGALAALDSVAVVTLLGDCEASFGFTVADDELSAEVFNSVGSLVDWIAARAASEEAALATAHAAVHATAPAEAVSDTVSDTPAVMAPPLATPPP